VISLKAFHEMLRVRTMMPVLFSIIAVEQKEQETKYFSIAQSYSKRPLVLSVGTEWSTCAVLCVRSWQGQTVWTMSVCLCPGL
jgi:hypothetical protein